MNQPVKAALLSGLIFPGVGQISLGHKKRGWLIIATHLLVIFLIIKEVLLKANDIIAEMQKNGSAVDIESISNVTSGMVNFSDNAYLNILLILFLFGWLVSIFDAYKLGKDK